MVELLERGEHPDAPYPDGRPALLVAASYGHVSVVETLLQHWPGEWTDASDPNAPHEAPTLSLNIDKAATVLG